MSSWADGGDREDGEHLDGAPDVGNVDVGGSAVWTCFYGATVNFLYPLELLAVLVHRHGQLCAEGGPYSTIHPRVVERLGEGAGYLALLLAEVADPEIDYPVTVRRGAVQLRLHKHLEVLDWVLDYFVLETESGSVSYDTVQSDIANRPCASSVAMSEDLRRIRLFAEELRSGHQL